jgi:hypothetical protein
MKLPDIRKLNGAAKARQEAEQLLADARAAGDGLDLRGRLAEAWNRVADSDAAGAARAVAREAAAVPALAQAAGTRAREAASTVPVRVQVGRPARRPILPLVVVGAITAAIGAFLAWVLDPQMGRTRRAVTRDRLAGGARRFGRWSARRGRWLKATASATAERLQRPDAPAEELDEVALTNKVRSELFRDPAINKGTININAERDVVFLRGTVPSHELVAELGSRVERIDGVRKVVNLLHVPGAPIPVMTEDYAEERAGG